jgi:hypothetical protein
LEAAEIGELKKVLERMWLVHVRSRDLRHRSSNQTSGGEENMPSTERNNRVSRMTDDRIARRTSENFLKRNYVLENLTKMTRYAFWRKEACGQKRRENMIFM